MTCMISGLPIDYGTDVLLVPLAEERNGLNSGAASDWTPILPPIPARYNDYGFIEDIQEVPHFRLAMERLGVSSEDLAHMIKEGKFPLERNPYRDTQPRQSFTMIRQDAWLEFLDAARQAGVWELNPDIAEEAAHWSVNIREIANKEFEMLYPQFSQAPEDPKAAEEFALRRQEKFDNMLERFPLTGIDPNSALGEWCSFSRPSRSLARGNGSGLYIQQLPATCSKMQRAEALEFARAAWSALTELEEASNFLYCLRKRWEPAPSGPQFGETAIHWIWAKKQKELCDRIFDAELAENQQDSWFSPSPPYQAAISLREAENIAKATAAAKSRKPKGGV